MATGQTLIQC